MKRLNIFTVILPLIFGLLAACGGGGSGGSDSETPSEPPQAIEPRAVILNDELIRPWGISFLPDSRMLVSEKGGTMVILSADGITILEEVIKGDCLMLRSTLILQQTLGSIGLILSQELVLKRA